MTVEDQGQRIDHLLDGLMELGLAGVLAFDFVHEIGDIRAHTHSFMMKLQIAMAVASPPPIYSVIVIDLFGFGLDFNKNKAPGARGLQARLDFCPDPA